MKNPNTFTHGLMTEPLSRERLDTILSDIQKLKVGVIGDGCIDIYWHADMTISELSRETPHHSLPVVREIFSPGAAGNVATNLKALGCKEVLFCSVIGRDWRGNVLMQQFLKSGIDDSYMLLEEDWITPAYCKPIRFGLQNTHQEDARIDFVNMSPISREITPRLLKMVDRLAIAADVIVVNDQFKYGIVGAEVRERLSYWGKQGKLILVDSRDRIGLFDGVILKPNELEIFKWHRPESDLRNSTWEDWIEAGILLMQKVGAPCCMTLGDKGAIWFDSGGYVHVPTRPVEPPIDVVGAGDCFAASLVCALGTGISGPEAIAFAHLGSAVVLKKMGTTGTASPDEIKERYQKMNKESLTDGR